jgi:hypothetical protein
MFVNAGKSEKPAPMQSRFTSSGMYWFHRKQYMLQLAIPNCFMGSMPQLQPSLVLIEGTSWWNPSLWSLHDWYIIYSCMDESTMFKFL